MTQLATFGAASAPTGVITVADLLSRYSPATVATEPEPPTVPVSVASLLQREGHPAPRAAELEAARYEAVGYEVTEYAEEDGAARRRPSPQLVKRGAIAAGVLLAAGSALGAAVVTTADPAPAGDTEALGDQRAPERNWLDGQTPAVPDLAPEAAAAPLDPGTAPDDSWMRVAFPTSTADGPSASAGGGSPAAGDGADAEAGPPAAEGTDGGAGNGGGTPPGGDDEADGPAGSGDQNEVVVPAVNQDEQDDDRGDDGQDDGAPAGNNGGGAGGGGSDEGSGGGSDDADDDGLLGDLVGVVGGLLG